jgi:hypothetical protein
MAARGRLHMASNGWFYMAARGRLHMASDGWFYMAARGRLNKHVPNWLMGMRLLFEFNVQLPVHMFVW